MKKLHMNLKTDFWKKELPEFKEATVNVIWFFLGITALNTIYNMLQKSIFGTSINILVLLVITLMILSYNKNKKERKTK